MKKINHFFSNFRTRFRKPTFAYTKTYNTFKRMVKISHGFHVAKCSIITKLFGVGVKFSFIKNVIATFKNRGVFARVSKNDHESPQNDKGDKDITQDLHTVKRSLAHFTKARRLRLNLERPAEIARLFYEDFEQKQKN